MDTEHGEDMARRELATFMTGTHTAMKKTEQLYNYRTIFQ
jgi:hypothetical protein